MSDEVRSGMSAIIRKLRGMTNTALDDYEVSGVSYWSDLHLQEILDDSRVDFYEMELRPIPKTVSSHYVYLRYDAPHGNLETIASGTVNFALTLSTGEQAGTADYSVDYVKGIITFNANQGGTAWFLSGRSYDLNTAAADVWERKANYFAMSYDVKTDGHDLSRSQLFKQAREQAEYWRGKCGAYSVDLLRGDEATGYEEDDD